jgi:hypothetical protein
VARRRPPQLEDVDAASFLRTVGNAALAHSPGIALDVQARGDLRVAPGEARLLLRGLMRRLLPAGGAGALSLRLDGPVLSIAFVSADAADADAPEALPEAPGAAGVAARSDTGHVPVLLHRLAQRFGWRLEFPSAQQARIVLQPASQTMWTSARA